MRPAGKHSSPAIGLPLDEVTSAGEAAAAPGIRTTTDLPQTIAALG